MTPSQVSFEPGFGAYQGLVQNLVGRGPRSDLVFPRTDTRSISGRFFAIRYAIRVATLLS